MERIEKRVPTFKTIGLDVGLTHFYTDSNGETIANPRHLRKSELALKRLARRMSKTKKGSKNRTKFRNKLARKHLKVSRQRKDFAVKTARCVVRNNDLVAYEDLKVRNIALKNINPTVTLDPSTKTDNLHNTVGLIFLASAPKEYGQK